jgi:RHH-type proline utilization regulon transcriptional repressor/proline dehydrogenase/delta 1-pyrroline-5-carboxylate dehydrogenase
MLAPRGRVLCLGPDAESLLAQTVQALAAGNAVVAAAPGATAALQPLAGGRFPLAVHDVSVSEELLETAQIDLVASAADAATLAGLRRALARRKGPIVRLVTEAIDPAAYVHERAICVDTTAAGGNASLLAAAE